MEKENLSICGPFLVQPELLRKRQSTKTFCFNRKLTTNPHLKTKLQTHIYTQIQSPEKSVLSEIHPNHPKINWLRYNILVGIYENWLRLYPYIQHFLSKFPGANPSISLNLSQFDFLKRTKSSLG